MGWILAVGTLLLGGFLELTPDLRSGWPVAGTWQIPVGHPNELGAPGPDGGPPYSSTRNVGGPTAHQGSDLSNRQGHGLVRAAAHGVVISAFNDTAGKGYGKHVVVAHRTRDRGLVFSVYAHLAPGSTRALAGMLVHRGDTLGRVGQSGTASSPHLHFEIRVPDHPFERWERAGVVDPLAFVTHRLGSRDRDSLPPRPGLAWAEDRALLDAGENPEARLTRGRWRLMLAMALPADSTFSLPAGPAETTSRLISAGVLGPAPPLDPLEPTGWTEVQADLERMARVGHTLNGSPLHPAAVGPGRSRPEGQPGGDAPSLARAIAALAGLATRRP